MLIDMMNYRSKEMYIPGIADEKNANLAFSLSQHPTSSNYYLHTWYLGDGSSFKEIENYPELRVHHCYLRQGQPLYCAGDPLRAFYLIRSGSIKTSVPLDSGQEQVLGFFLPADILGVDALATNTHNVDAVAMEDCEICVIPFDNLELVGHESKLLHRFMYRALSREIVRNQNMMLLLATMNSEERVAVFLLNLLQRYLARGLSPTQFNLPMTQDEIGSYLGLKSGIIDKIFSKFQRTGMIAIQQKYLRILNLKSLERFVRYWNANDVAMCSSSTSNNSRRQSKKVPILNQKLEPGLPVM